MQFLLALKFLTIIRLPGQKQIDPLQLGRSTVYFPLVGLVIGLILAGLAWIFQAIMPVFIGSALLVAAGIFLTGGMHIDGFIDTCDGIGGQKPVEERWRIMHEGRVGAFGVAGAILLLLVKFAALMSIPRGLIIPAVIIMPVVSRWAMVFVIAAFPYARPQGMGKVFKENTKWSAFWLGAFFTIIISMLAAFLFGIALFYFVVPLIMLVILLIAYFYASYLKGKFGGLTGDCYGAVNEVAEACVLILISIAAFNNWM